MCHHSHRASGERSPAEAREGRILEERRPVEQEAGVAGVGGVQLRRQTERREEPVLNEVTNRLQVVPVRHVVIE